MGQSVGSGICLQTLRNWTFHCAGYSFIIVVVKQVKVWVVKKLDVIGMLFCPLNVFEDSLFEGLGNHFQHLSEMGNPEGFISKTFVQSCQRRQVLS